jgi:hypothetical protein
LQAQKIGKYEAVADPGMSFSPVAERHAFPGSGASKRPVLIALAIAMTASSAALAEEAWPSSSASDVSVFVTMLRFRIYAEHCSAKVPGLGPEFESLMENLGLRMGRISERLLASADFKGMKGKPVPARIIDAFRDSFEDMKRNLERQDAASVCPKSLRTFGKMDDVSLEADLATTMSAVQNMSRKL